MKTIINIFILSIIISGCHSSKSLVQTKSATQPKLEESMLLKMKGMYIDAQGQKNIGNFKQAMSLLDRVLEIDPNHHAALYDQAMIFNGQGEFSSAMKKVEKASKLDPNNQWYQILRAQLYYRAGKLDVAEDIYVNLIEKEERNFEYNYDLAGIRMRMNDYEGAIDALNDVERHVGLNEEVIIEKQSLYLEMNKPEMARVEIEKLIEANPGEARYYSLMASIYEFENNEAKVMENLAKVEELDPNNVEVKFYLYDYYMQKNEVDKAEEIIIGVFENPQINIDSKMEILLRNYQKVEAHTSEMSKAYELIDILTRVHPDEAKSHAIFGDFLLLDDKPQQARDAFKAAIDIDPSRVIIWNQLVILDAQLNNPSVLAEDCKQALEYYPTTALFYFYNGVANNQLKNYDTAIESLLAGKELVYNDPDLKAEFFSALGDSYHEKGNDKESDKYFDKSLDINANNSFVLNNYSYYLSLRKVELDRAEEMAKLANELNPNSPSFQDTYAWILFQNNKLDQSKVWMQKAMNNGGNKSGIIVEHYGDILFKLGEKEAAITYWEKAKLTGDYSALLLQKIQSKNLIE